MKFVQSGQPVSVPEIPRPSGWRRGLHSLIARFYFEEIALRHAERLPEEGPVLFVGLHRNGALDGFVYNAVLPASVYMLSRQLTTHPVGRLLFAGIEVVREKDRVRFPEYRAVNRAAMKACHDVLAGGGNLFVFPEGTSSLGPKHLSFQSGAMHLIDQLAGEGRAFTVVPVGITYDAPDRFRSGVEVVVGKPVSLDFAAESGARERLGVIRQRVTAALEEVGINVESQQRLEAIEQQAAHAPGSYHAALKRLASGCAVAEVVTHRKAEGLVDDLRRLLLLPVGLSAAVLNFPPLLAAGFAGRRLADGRNVISLWRVMAGFPAFCLWIPFALVLCWLFSGWPGALFYLAISLLGLRSWSPIRALLPSSKRAPESLELPLATER